MSRSPTERRGRTAAEVRRTRLAFLVAQRQTLVLDRPTLLLRVISLTVLATFVSLTPEPLVLLLLLPPAGLVAIRARLPDRELALRERGRWWLVEGWADSLSAQLALFVAAWMTTELPLDARLGAVGVAALLVSVVFLRLCLTSRWYRPDEWSGRSTEFLRRWAGPIAAALSAAIALPAPWPTGSQVLVLLLVALPVSVTVLTLDQDLTIVHAVRLIQQEAQEGRQIVLDATHGSLSTNLRLLEQQARQYRDQLPQLYELALSANCRLRETLTLADPTLDTARGPDTLGAVVNTLVLSVGARSQFTVSLDRLADPDRDLARLAISDLVSASLAAGATELQVDLRLDAADPAWVVVSVADDGRSERADDPLTALQRRLGEIDGEIVGPTLNRSGRQILARWRAAEATG